MTDAYGRPTANDALTLAQGVRTALDYQDQKKEAAQAKQLQTNSYQIAQKLGQDPNADLSGYDAQSVYAGRKLRWDANLDKAKAIQAQTENTTAGFQQQITKLEFVSAKQNQLLQAYKAARAAGNDQEAKQIGQQIFNMSPNGLHVKDSGDGNLTITDWSGNTKQQKDLPIQQYDDKLAAYFNMDEKDRLKMNLHGMMLTRQKNYEIMKQAEPLLGPNNQVIYRVPAGTRDPQTGDVKDAFYTDQNGNEIPADKAKGFKPMSDTVKQYFETSRKAPDQATRTAMANAGAGLQADGSSKGSPSGGSTPSTFEKEAEFLSRTYKIPLDKATDMLRTDNHLAQLLQAYNNEVSTLTFTVSDPKQLAAAESKLRKQYGLDEYFSKNAGGGSGGSADSWKNYDTGQ